MRRVSRGKSGQRMGRGPADKPLVSVIVPVYNGEKYLKEMIGSVLLQTLGDFEVLCINDGSTDGSGEIIQNMMRRDKRDRKSVV